MKKAAYKNNEIKRNYYLNLFSENAEKKIDSSTLKVTEFSWNIRPLNLGTIAEIGLVQISNNNASDYTTYCFRCQNTYQDGYDSFNQTSAVVYLNNGFHSPQVPTYHKLISDQLNKITIVVTDDITNSNKVYAGINPNISFALIFHIIDYVDPMQLY